MYLHLWCEHRGAGREFCAGCVYADDEDESTKEADDVNAAPKTNHKRLEHADPVHSATVTVQAKRRHPQAAFTAPAMPPFFMTGR
jgi:hypothetical protein